MFICFIFYYFKKNFLKGIIKYLRICYTVFFCTSYNFLFILILKEKFINYFNFKFFLNFDFGSFFRIKNVCHGLSFFGFCIKKKLFFFELYIEKKMVVRYLNFKGFCNKIGLPISYTKYISWAQFNLNLKLNFLSKLLYI